MHCIICGVGESVSALTCSLLAREKPTPGGNRAVVIGELAKTVCNSFASGNDVLGGMVGVVRF